MARTFIDSGMTLWFAYAIAKHESKVSTAAGPWVLYNQFVPEGARMCVGNVGPTCARVYVKEDEGIPYFTYSPEGWGLMQLDRSRGAPGSTTLAEIWNWRQNVRAGLARLGAARAEADQWMNSLRRDPSDPGQPEGQRPQSEVDTGRARWDPQPPGSPPTQPGTQVIVNPNIPIVPVPNFPTVYPNCPQFTNANIEDAVTMKIYNGAKPHFVGWISAAVGWRFTPVNTSNGRYYVREVCTEVEP